MSWRSPLSENVLWDCSQTSVVTVKGRTKADMPVEKDYLARQIIGEREPLTPLGSIFENNCMVFLNSLVAKLMHRMVQPEADLKQT